MQAEFASPTVMRCSAPARSEPGVAVVTVSTDGGASFGGSLRPTSGLFRYLAQSFVSGLSPRAGPDTGGTAVTVLGAGFSRDFRYACSFGTGLHPGKDRKTRAVAPAIPAVFVSASQLTCIAPPVTAVAQLKTNAPVTISVDLGEGFTKLSASSDAPIALTFTYLPSVQLRVLCPDHGPVTGGTIIDISGANFGEPARGGGPKADTFVGVSSATASDTVWCRFGSTVTVGTHLSDGWIQCRTPPKDVHTAANVEVTVSVNGGADFAGRESGSPLVCC